LSVAQTFTAAQLITNTLSLRNSDNTVAEITHLNLQRGTGAGSGAEIKTMGDGANGASTILFYAQTAGLLSLSQTEARVFQPFAVPAATTSIPSIKMPHGTAPSSPTNGDWWTTTAGAFVRINGTTVGPLIDSTTVGATAAFYGKINNTSTTAITAATSATLNRVHVVSGTSADYDITISGLSPATGDVLGFYVKDYAAATKQFRLDAGGTVKIAGRTRYLILLHTNVVLLRWDGTDWQPLVLNLDTPWVDAGASTITAVTTNPTKGGGTFYDKVYWRRVSNSCHIRYEYRQSTAGTAGSGDYLWSVPIGVVDSNLASFDTGASSPLTAAYSGLGTGRGDFGGTGVILHLSLYSTTKLRFVFSNSFVASSTASLANAEFAFHVFSDLPMTDW
jgi:hypothetical protein